jgi:hypothetical protein
LYNIAASIAKMAFLFIGFSIIAGRLGQLLMQIILGRNLTDHEVTDYITQKKYLQSQNLVIRSLGHLDQLAEFTSFGILKSIPIFVQLFGVFILIWVVHELST